MEFTFAPENGSPVKVASQEVRKIVFDPAAAPITIETTNRGQFEAVITGYENNLFWLTHANQKTEKFPATFVKSIGGGSIKTITHGAKVDLEKHLVTGKVTVFDFYADWCAPCRLVSPILEKMTHEDPGVVVRKVDVVDWNSPVAKQYGITTIPYFRVYDGSGKLVGAVSGADTDTVKQLVNKAKGSNKS
jgi:thiol-disulfide isomerase/thioredoxin